VLIVASQSSASRVKSTTGGALLALGIVLILFHLNSLALQLQLLFSTPRAETLDSCARLGVTVLQALQTIIFDHDLRFSFASNLLVLSLAFAIILIGITLRTQARRSSKLDAATARVSLKGQP
jgi:hypothetical protein